jgi:hypothetical protein
MPAFAGMTLERTMGFFDRLAFGWRLGTTSLGVVNKDTTLMLFPILSGISGLLLMAAFVFGIGPETLRADLHLAEQTDQVPPIYYVCAFVMYFALTFIAVYFNVALIGAAQQSLSGKDTTIGDGLAVANQHLGKIAAWAAISGTVGLLLGALERNSKFGGFVRSILGAAWTVITYFIVPVMIFENQAPTAAIGRSVSLMKASWGENVGAQVGIGLVTFLAIVAIVVVAVAGTVLVPKAAVVLLPLMLIAVPVVILLAMAAKAVLTVGLYDFATRKGGTGPFNPDELKAAFR